MAPTGQVLMQISQLMQPDGSIYAFFPIMVMVFCGHTDMQPPQDKQCL